MRSASLGDEDEGHDKPYDTKVLGELRERWIEGPFRLWLMNMLAMNPRIMSGRFTLSSYYNDEASDAVHNRVVFYAVAEPDDETNGKDYWHYTGNGILPNAEIDKLVTSGKRPMVRDMISFPTERSWSTGLAWDENDGAVTLFGAYAPDSNQDDSEYQTYATFRRSSDGVEVTIVGEKIRPGLDGYASKWARESREPRDFAKRLDHLFGDFSVDAAFAEKIIAAGWGVYSPKLPGEPVYLLDDLWLARAIATVGEMAIDAKKDEKLRNRIDGMLRLGLKPKRKSED